MHAPLSCIGVVDKLLSLVSKTADGELQFKSIQEVNDSDMEVLARIHDANHTLTLNAPHLRSLTELGDSKRLQYYQSSPRSHSPLVLDAMATLPSDVAQVRCASNA